MSKVNFNTSDLEKKINTKFSQLVRKVVLDGMRQLIRQSPVDTGRLKANWSTSITEMSSGTVEAQGPKTSRGRISAPLDYNASKNGVSTYKLGQTAFLHNNLEYVLPLEYGTSKQAPVGWIRSTSITMQRQFDKIKGIL